MPENNPPVGLFLGDALRDYAFGDGHPFGPDRLDAFWREASERGLPERTRVLPPARADRADLERFHTPAYLDLLSERSRTGEGFLDYGDTPAFKGVLEAACTVVGTTLAACREVLEGRSLRAFVPIAGLHHGQRHAAAGFCAVNDCGVAIETLIQAHGIDRVGYVDIDAHHGDGVYYAFESDPRVIFADLHEDGRFLYPGTGAAHERGTGPAAGTKLNIPMRPDAGDDDFLAAWGKVEAFLDDHAPEFLLFQCGADSIAGDPITHLKYSAAAHAHAAARLCLLADRHCAGRLVVMGGGGYNRRNLALAWCAVLESLVGAGGG
ncbi:MAG: acetoin utilization protein AcuC [Gammaproteobacteria bacterium]|nr:acetoin utilization protein AcuC [Gammaproteobacteria bacterium]